jgi:hypothetical protein
VVGTSQDQVEGGTTDDEHGGRRAGDQPPGPGRAAIGITAAADHVEDRLVRHKANVQLARRGDESGAAGSSELTIITALRLMGS